MGFPKMQLFAEILIGLYNFAIKLCIDTYFPRIVILGDMRYTYYVFT